MGAVGGSFCLRLRVYQPEPPLWFVFWMLLAVIVMLPFAMMLHIASACRRGWAGLTHGEPGEVPEAAAAPQGRGET